MKKTIYLTMLILCCACGSHDPQPKQPTNRTDYLSYAIQIAQSEMKHNPELWMTDFQSKPKWEYTHGLMARTMLELYAATKDSTYLNYVQAFADKMIHADGTIETYNRNLYNMDRIQGGRFLIQLYELNPQPQYITAIETLRDQLREQPRTLEGGFWHKQVYPNQMWLDGLYTGTSFYAQYTAWKKDESAWDDIVNQFIVVDAHTKKTNGLNFHGWDESKQEAWSNAETGCSNETWGRAEGWYMMALCDVLEVLPTQHTGYAELSKILTRVSASLLEYRDSTSKMWYQVPDKPKEEGNYLESTCSAMYCYAFAKGTRLGILSKEYKDMAAETFDGMWKTVVEEQADGTVNLTQCCGVAGLGGTPYRDGTYSYYIGEIVRDNDPKGVAPFILAALELNR